jgi:hypothetical protein
LRGSANSALFVAAAVFRSLYGSWIINRTYTSRCSGYPSGHSTGTADFIFEKVSSATLFAQEKPSDTEYLYSEKTQMSSSTGTTFLGTRQYIYRYDEANDKLQVFFVNRGKEISLGHLFHEVDLELPLEEASSQISCSEKLPWRAKAIHHCSPDTYDVTYTFFFKGVDLSKWRVGYEVKGPKKDYSIETWYTR